MNVILAVETSCDETAAAIVKNGVHILGSSIYSQIHDHHKYGGVVPEIASRKHIETIIRIIRNVFDESGLIFKEIEAIAVTTGPGLIGSLLVGLCVAKALAFAWDLPFIPVDHLEGHIYASFFVRPDIEFPFVCLVVSGGHTDLYLVKGHGDYALLGQTRDDAAGEAFDKVAKVLGLGYPGGPVIDKLARQADPAKINFPRAFLEKGSMDFSFSGLKTAVCNYVRYGKGKDILETNAHEESGATDDKNRRSVSEINPNGPSKLPRGMKIEPILEAKDQGQIMSIAAGFQEAVIDVLVGKSMEAMTKTGVHTLAIGGGVASNTRLRERLEQACRERGVDLVIPPPHLCVDNASMIGAAGYFNQERATRDWSIAAHDCRRTGLI
ncbi:tRNA (adenosine(37)-N6)-threonylcarbamoyltransferase complex transferase subunit TsaD [bacterium]|nr:tRNA (adenosine(37)-N6)-threonylcarbamoyltransferase complex transferase subunit TsaD [bacterium]